jgi:subtilisin family serine protease
MKSIGNARSFTRTCIPLMLNVLIVIGLTLSGLTVDMLRSPKMAEARVVAPAGEPGHAAAPQHVQKRAERKHQGKHDRARKNRKQDHKNKDANQDRKTDRKHDRKKDRARDRQPARELTTGRLPAAETVAQATGSRLSAEDRYIVVLEAGSGDALDTANAIAIDRAGVTPTHVYRNVFPGFAAVIPDDKLDEIRRDPRVKSVVPDDVVYADAQTLPNGIRRVDTPLDPSASIDGIDTRVDIDVAVIDSAGNDFHPDLNVWAYANCTDRADADDNGHGTHVGGTIGALDNGIGVVGVAPGARLWNIRVLRADPAGGSGGMRSWIICGLDTVAQYATDQGDGLGDIEVANASIGGPGSDSSCGPGSLDAYHQAYCNVVAAGIPVVVSAGNDAVNASTQVPAMYDEVITVSALTDSDGRPGGEGPATWAGPDESFATFSNFGPDVDLAAPGVDVLSTLPTGSCEFCRPSGYGEMSGTSMASPHVAGAAALYLLTHPGATPAQVKAGLLGARDRIALPGDPDGISEGVLDVADPPAPPVVSPPPPSVESSPPSAAAQAKHKSKNKHKKKKKKH